MTPLGFVAVIVGTVVITLLVVGGVYMARWLRS